MLQKSKWLLVKVFYIFILLEAILYEAILYNCGFKVSIKYNGFLLGFGLFWFFGVLLFFLRTFMAYSLAF